MTTPSGTRAGGRAASGRQGGAAGRATLVVVLVGIWVMLWGDASVANLLSGLVVAAGLLVTFPMRQRATRQVTFRFFPAVRFAGHFVRKIVESNVLLAREILRRRSRIKTGIIAVPLEGCSEVLVAAIANLTSLTPGTMTVEVKRDPFVLYVHVLQLHDLERSRREIEQLRDMTLRAFGRDGR